MFEKDPGINDGLSIITIVLNQQSLIEETIKSVICQKKYVNIEYIIIDGGSTDGTLNIIGNYMEEIDHLVSGPDGGIYEAINKGISLARNSLIGLIHCGDCYTLNALPLVYKAYQMNPADVIYGDIVIEEEINKKLVRYASTANHKFLSSKMSIFHPSTFVKLATYKRMGLYNTSFRSAADYEYLLRLYLTECVFLHIPVALALFRKGGLSSINFRLSFTENYQIRLKHQGMLIALKYLIITVSLHSLYTFRKLFLITMIGKQNFDNLKYFVKKWLLHRM